MSIAASELILNEDNSIYHLNLKPHQIGHTIITVGDPDRVDMVAKHLDNIQLTVQKREFKTVTGTLADKQITIISTGIGTDNIDIVLNELDALVNIDFNTRLPKQNHTQLDIIRIGTSGAIQPDIPVDSILISETAIGLDSLLHFYKSEQIRDLDFENALASHTQWDKNKSKPYVVNGHDSLIAQFMSDETILGTTATNVGFYGPQGRHLRLKTSDPLMNQKLENFSFRESKITNLEMETAGIYGLAALLGHRAISLNAILANRANGTFSKTPDKTVKNLIEYTFDYLMD